MLYLEIHPFVILFLFLKHNIPLLAFQKNHDRNIFLNAAQAFPCLLLNEPCLSGAPLGIHNAVSRVYQILWKKSKCCPTTQPSRHHLRQQIHFSPSFSRCGKINLGLIQSKQTIMFVGFVVRKSYVVFIKLLEFLNRFLFNLALEIVFKNISHSQICYFLGEVYLAERNVRG